MEDSVRQKIIDVATTCTIGMGYPGECGAMAIWYLQGYLGRTAEPEEVELFKETWSFCVSQMVAAKSAKDEERTD